MIEIEVLYSDLTKVRVDVTDKEGIENLRKDGVLAIVLSSIDPVTKKKRRVEYVESTDNYLFVYDNKDAQEIVCLYAFDNDDGKWYHVGKPFASDGYRKPKIPPFLLPYKPDFNYWIFRGEFITKELWEDSEKIRREMK